jgi:predicted RNA-binding Zn-ribbon protein involved in translation (DUF1610 family)
MPHPEPIHWAAKAPQWQIRRLYQAEAQGMLDDEQLDAVGLALWERCDSILAVTAAHHGHVGCPSCGTVIARQQPPPADEVVSCPSCDWSLPWAVYHRSYRGKQLYGANAVEAFTRYHQAFPQATTARAKMLLIDQLIHAFHVGLRELGRPVAANLIEGSLAEVIDFLDALASGGASSAEIGDSGETWRRTIAATSWYGSLHKKGPEGAP